jgi:hypothetical protein
LGEDQFAKRVPFQVCNMRRMVAARAAAARAVAGRGVEVTAVVVAAVAAARAAGAATAPLRSKLARVGKLARAARRQRSVDERSLYRTNSRGHQIAVEVKDALSVAFGLLQDHSLQHAACQQMDDTLARRAAIAESAHGIAESAHGGAPRVNARRQLYRAPSVLAVVEESTRSGKLEEEPEVTNISDWVIWHE